MRLAAPRAAAPRRTIGARKEPAELTLSHQGMTTRPSRQDSTSPRGPTQWSNEVGSKNKTDSVRTLDFWRDDDTVYVIGLSIEFKGDTDVKSKVWCRRFQDFVGRAFVSTIKPSAK